MNDYWPGSVVTLTATFRNAAGTLANPTAVTITVRQPGGTTTTPTASSTSTGVYTASYNTTGLAPGVYRWRAAGTGTVVAAAEGEFLVRPSIV
jgi:uncharacterized protein YfaS (alpha-2-macroglobulin family)